MSWEYRVDGEAVPLSLYLEAALDQNTPKDMNANQRLLVFGDFLRENPEYNGRFDPDAATALAEWLKRKFPG